MSEQDNIRTVQSIYEAFGRGDVPAILEKLSDGIEWHHRGAPDVPWGKSRTSKSEVQSFFGELATAVDVLGLDVQHYIAQGDKVVVLGDFRGRSKETGKEFDDPWAMVWTLENGKIVGYRAYQRHGGDRGGVPLRIP